MSCWPGGQIFIAENQRELDEKLSLKKPKNVSLQDFKKNNLIGNPDDCVQRIQQYSKLGTKYFMLFFGDLPRLDGLKVFAEKVVNKIGSVN
jgi:alkanesulfonate monooxygenase SsuD/methylene tetrahydromethanopterin reductase-like flavin-dependent oxidoreductase (luciferase family)